MAGVASFFGQVEGANDFEDFAAGNRDFATFEQGLGEEAELAGEGVFGGIEIYGLSVEFYRVTGEDEFAILANE